MNLNDLIKQREIKETGERITLTVSGVGNSNNNIFDVYRVPLECLYYNDQNGRINTTYMKYKSQNNSLEPERGSSEYNKLFETFIYQSNENALKKTLESIKVKGQQVPGVVLSDGRVIDGNRRLTALRMIQNKTGEQQYFNAVVLPIDFSTEADKKIIKSLELDLQLAREEKVDYNPIDKIYDVYDTVVLKKQMTRQEYRKAAGYGNVTPVDNDIMRAELMIDFINMISPGPNPENRFYLIRDLELDGPIKEIDKTLNSLKSDNKVAIKESVLTYMLLTKTNLIKEEPTKAMRDLKNNVITKHEYVDRFVNIIDNRVDVLFDEFENKPITHISEINDIIENNTEVYKAAKTMVTSTDNLIYKGGLDIEKTRVIAQLDDVLNKLQNIEGDEFEELEREQRANARDIVSGIREEIHRIKREL